MNAEKEVVNVWLNRAGFFTIRDINAKSRVADFLALRPGLGIRHVEVNCSVSSSGITKNEEKELLRKFTDPNVVKVLKKRIRDYTGSDADYQKVLVTTAKVSLEGVDVVQFQDVLAEVVNKVDRQKYSNPVIRTLQLLKYSLIASPTELAGVLGSSEKHRPLTATAREQMLKDLLMQDTAERLFRKKENEELLLQLLKFSTLKSPERLAAAIGEVLTKRSASRFMNVLLQKEEIKEAAEEEIAKDKKLEEFFVVQ